MLASSMLLVASGYEVVTLKDVKDYESTALGGPLPFGEQETIATTGVVVVFGHNQKAGGMTVRRTFTAMCLRARWVYDELIFGGRQWYRYESSSPNGRHVGGVKDWFEQTPDERMKIRAITMDWQFFGMCSHLPRPCVYLTALREPLSQVQSSFHYFCTHGFENRSLWTDDQKRNGKCDTPIVDWPPYPQIVDTPFRLGSSWAETFQDHNISAALATLHHPCFWAMDTADMADDLAVFGTKLGNEWRVATTHVKAANQLRADVQAASNLSKKPSYAKEPPTVEPSDAYQLLTGKLRDVNSLYIYYRHVKNAMWQRDPVFC